MSSGGQPKSSSTRPTQIEPPQTAPPQIEPPQNDPPRNEPGARPQAPAIDVGAELAALAVLFAVSRTLGPRKRRRMAKALAQLVDDWTQTDSDHALPAPAAEAMRRAALRFVRPAQALLADPPRRRRIAAP